MNTPYVFKRCTKCGKWKIANLTYFVKEKNGKYGLTGKCRICYNKNKQKYYKNANRKEYYKAYRKTDNYKNYQKEYRKSERNKEIQNKYRKSEAGKKSQDKYKNSDKGKEYYKNYWASEKGKSVQFNHNVKRRLSEESQGRGITIEQWDEVYKYFNWKCAYSGMKLLKSNRNLDHIIPLNDNGVNEIWNCVPMYNIYNFNKQDKSPLEWYKEQEYFSEERLAKIVEWQQYAYDKWATEEDGELILITDLK